MDAVTAVARGHSPDLDTEALGPLAALRGCPQTAVFHGEGDVATHTRMVLDLAAVDRAPAERPASAGQPDDALAGTLLRLGALLHDVGKPAVTRELEPGVYTSRGHEDEGAAVVATLFATHPTLRTLPLGAFGAVQALVRHHMWTYSIDRISPGALARASHLVDPALLAALWRADTRGRICDDAAGLADQVAYAELVLADADAARPDSYGLLDHATSDLHSVPAAVRRRVFRQVTTGQLTDPGAAAAALAAAERGTRPGSLTYTIGLPGTGKSTWARQRWATASDGVVLSAEGARRKDRAAAAAAALTRLPRLLAAGAHVLVDATHLTLDSRRVLLTYADRYAVPAHAVYFDAPLALALARQVTRPRTDGVPDAAVRRMAARLEWPAPDEYATLSVVDPDGRTWDYTPASRWTTTASAAGAGTAAR